jgi:hypothetical protein
MVSAGTWRREHAVSAPALRVHRPLRNSLSVTIRGFLDQLIILQQQRMRGPAVREYWLSAMGLPALVVS